MRGYVRLPARMIECAWDGGPLAVVLSEGGGVYAARRFGLEGSTVRAVVCPLRAAHPVPSEGGTGRHAFFEPSHHKRSTGVRAASASDRFAGGSNATMTALDERDPPEPQALACAVIPIAVLSRGFAPPPGLKPAAQKRDRALSYYTLFGPARLSPPVGTRCHTSPGKGPVPHITRLKTNATHYPVGDRYHAEGQSFSS